MSDVIEWNTDCLSQGRNSVMRVTIQRGFVILERDSNSARALLWVFVFSLLVLCSALSYAETVPNLMWGRSVVKVMADSREGRVSMGSGVVVATNRVATNCHVTRSARSITIIKGVSRYKVTAQAAELAKDVCILHTQNLKLPTAELGNVADAEIGQEVFVFGFPGAVGLGMVRGVVSGLHAYGSSQIVETDAGFMRGTSGGGLFDSRGFLIGLPTFMANNETGGHFYAVPIDWIMQVVNRKAEPIAPLQGRAFWETESLFPDAEN